MKKEIFDLIKKELQYIFLLFILSLIIFKIAFFKENMSVLLRNILSVFWLFVLPGYFMMIYWKEKLGFTERFIIGVAISAAIIGIFSYYLGLIGLNIKYYYILLPIALVIIGIFFNLSKKD